MALSPYIINSLAGFAIGGALLYFHRRMRLGRQVGQRRWWGRALGGVGVSVVSLSVLLFAYGLWVSSGDTSPTSFEIADGIDYERLRVDSGTGNDAVGHLVTIELGNPCVVLHTSKVEPDGTAKASKNIKWAEQNSMLLAMNASFFYPYKEEFPYLNITPGEGEEVNVLGATVWTGPQALSQGIHT